jgi:hypothetical protein
MDLRWTVRAALAMAVALCAIPATAQVSSVQMGGDWYNHKGVLIDIPLAGGAEFRNPFVNGLNCFPQTGCLANFKPRDGGLEAPLTVGAATVPVTTNGTAPATFNIPPAIFEFNTAMVTDGAAVTINPTVISLTTNFAAIAPAATSLTAMSFMSPGGATLTQVLNPQTSFMASRLNLTPGGALASVTQTTVMGANAVPNVLRAGAWTTQTGRPGADFSFCRGGQTGFEAAGTHIKLGGVLNCTTPNVTNDPATGTFGKAYNGLVSYTAGPDAFGGTMMMLLDGGGRVAVFNGVTAITPGAPGAGGTATTTPKVCFSPIGQAGATGFRNQITGAGFMFASSAFLQPGPCYRGLIQTPGQQIATLGPLLPTGTNTVMFPTPGGGTFTLDLNVLPPDQNKNIAAPFTTGSVFVQNTGTNQGQPATTTLSLGGSLNTSMGVGNITLVSGALSHRVLSNQNTSYLSYVRMVTFAPEPGASLMLGVALVGIGGAYWAMRRRSVA